MFLSPNHSISASVFTLVFTEQIREISYRATAASPDQQVGVLIQHCSPAAVVVGLCVEWINSTALANGDRR